MEIEEKSNGKNSTDNRNIEHCWLTQTRYLGAKNFIAAAYLVNEVRKQNEGKRGRRTAQEMYDAASEIAGRLGIQNPLPDKDGFDMMHGALPDLKQEDWEGVIACERSNGRMQLVPPALAELYAERLSARPARVLLAEAEKFAPSIEQTVKEHSDSHFVLTTQSVVYAEILKSIFKDYTNVEIVQADIYRSDFADGEFDLILACPNIGGRLPMGKQDFISNVYDLAALENLCGHLNDGGRLVTLTGRFFAAAMDARELRELIRRDYTIKEVAELPEKITGVWNDKACLLDIQNSPSDGESSVLIRRYDAERTKPKYGKVLSLSVAEEMNVKQSAPEEKGGVDPSRVFLQQDEGYLSYLNSAKPRMRLGDAAQCFRGRIVSTHSTDGPIGVVNISNLGDSGIAYDELERLDADERKVSSYLLREGDLLLSARGTVIRTAVFCAQDYPCLPSANLIAIRPKAGKLDGIWLKLFLDSPIGRQLLTGAQKGAMNLRCSDLENLLLPAVPFEEQQATAAQYRSELQAYRDAVDKAEKRWREALERMREF